MGLSKTKINNTYNIGVKKAKRSTCTYKVSAVGLNPKGEILGTASNLHRFSKYGGSLHAEMNLMKKLGTNLKTIILFRVGGGGNMLPIHPCEVCSKVAKSRNIKIISAIGDSNEH